MAPSVSREARRYIDPQRKKFIVVKEGLNVFVTYKPLGAAVLMVDSAGFNDQRLRQARLSPGAATDPAAGPRYAVACTEWSGQGRRTGSGEEDVLEGRGE